MTVIFQFIFYFYRVF